MARILISKHQSACLNRLWDCLKPFHEVHCVQNPAEAMLFLQESGLSVDLIITSVYDDDLDLFAFIRTLKAEPGLGAIPLLCFSMQRSSYATLLDSNVEQAALACGADKYLTMDSFCQAKAYTESCETCIWPGERCDYAALRKAIESVLKTGVKPVD